MFEDLYRNGVLVGCHADISDEGQSIYFPEISTTAMDSETKDNQGHTAKKVTVIDTVKYENLEPGREYRLMLSISLYTFSSRNLSSYLP